MIDRTKIVVGGAVVYNGKYLLLKRSPDKKTHPEKWEFVGGCPYEREVLEDTVRRETKEETGINITPKERHIFQVRSEETDWLCVYYVREASTDKVILSEEHTEFKRMGLEDAARLDLATGAARMVKIMGEPNGS